MHRHQKHPWLFKKHRQEAQQRKKRKRQIPTKCNTFQRIRRTILHVAAQRIRYWQIQQGCYNNGILIRRCQLNTSPRTPGFLRKQPGEKVAKRRIAQGRCSNRKGTCCCCRSNAGFRCSRHCFLKRGTERVNQSTLDDVLGNQDGCPADPLDGTSS